ncbi:MAG: hypothetical protein GY809_00325 [Planctomycetes bacterium]|nr:hypothetical protein [Planctomycetota bacterium]
MFYNKRVKILCLIAGLLTLIPIFRLAQLQLFSSPSYLAEIERLQRGTRQQTQTIRGRILDRNGRVIASEEPLFKLYVTYEKITRYADPKVQRAVRLSAQRHKIDQAKALAEANEAIEKGLEQIAYLMALCEAFGYTARDIEQTIQSYNNDIWNRRMFQAWRKNCRTSPLYLEHKDRIGETRGDDVIADLTRAFPDSNARIALVSDTAYDVLEMHSFFPLAELQSEEDQFLALTKLEGMAGVEVTAQASRVYPYKTAAPQLIGWVGPATQKADIRLFEHDRLARYQDGELCGREDGIERLCEPILRGRRGELTFDMDKNLVERTQKNFGQDVSLTLDIKLQQAIENYLTTRSHRPCCTPGKAAVVLDVQRNEILALVSVPIYDLNTVRYRYDELKEDKAKPMLNRALNKDYPPGSVAKPVVAVAGLESGTITAREVIDCPNILPPAGWPRCWTEKQLGYGHDDMWPGRNHARNAIKGSCNIYFSHLAERIELRTLQAWFSRFGYGRKVPLASVLQFGGDDAFDLRPLRQGAGRIIADAGNRKLAGIGQSNMRVTPLQVANSMATLARRGQFLNPTLFQTDTGRIAASHIPEDLGISPGIMDVVLDGMDAVVNELNGSAHAAFQVTDFQVIDFARCGVRVFGKTGSTERPENAWFSGFARDKAGRVLAIAVVVEGGESGGKDAAPLARDILDLCVQEGYLGTL